MSNERTTSSVEQLYDSLSGHFWEWTPSAHFREAHTQTVGALLRELASEKPVRIAELGCGHGTWLKLTVDEVRALGRRCTALGLDLSSERIRLAQTYLQEYPEVRVEKSDLLRSSPSGQFELAYAFEVFQYFSHAEQLRILETWLAHVAPGGAIVVLDKDRWSRHALMCDIQKRLGRLDFVLGPLRRYSPQARAVHRVIRYPDFRRLARDLRRRRLSVQVRRHHEFRSLTLRNV